MECLILIGTVFGWITGHVSAFAPKNNNVINEGSDLFKKNLYSLPQDSEAKATIINKQKFSNVSETKIFDMGKYLKNQKKEAVAVKELQSFLVQVADEFADKRQKNQLKLSSEGANLRNNHKEEFDSEID